MELNIVNNSCNNLKINTTTDLQNNEVITFRNCELDEVELDLADKFEITLKDGKYYAVRRKPQYPKTYVECCEILRIGSYFEPEIRNATTEECYIFMKLMKLKRCRDAYWKIAGEQMGLGEPWEPDWCNENKLKYCIECSFGTIDKTVSIVNGCFLAFPTKKMRDAFYENFKDLIEQCKELL